MFSKLMAWLPELSLRTLRVLCIGFIVLNSWSAYRVCRATYEKGMTSLSLYGEVFPHIIFILFYCAMLYVIWKYVRGIYARSNWLMPIIAVCLFEFFKAFIYGFLLWTYKFLVVSVVLR